MTLLLTGATGQLGRELLPRLQAMAPVLAPPRAAFDLAQPEQLASRLDAWRPRIIVNAAAWTDVDGAEADEAAATVINADAVAALADWAAAHGALLLHVSTDHVFDGRRTVAYTEADVPAPCNAYGRSKLAGERALAASTADYLCLRVGGLYGANARCFPGRLLARAREQHVLAVVDDQVGTPTRCAALAEAMAQLLAEVMVRREVGRFRSALYHLAPAGAVSRHGFAECILASAVARGWLRSAPTLRAVATVPSPGVAPRPAYAVLDSARLQADYGIALGHWLDGWTQLAATATCADFLRD